MPSNASHHRRGLLALGWILAAAGCTPLRGGGDVDDDPPAPGLPAEAAISAVVGVAADTALLAAIDELTVAVETDGEVAPIEMRWSRLGGAPPLPLEIEIPKLTDGRDIVATATARAADGSLLLQRRMETSARSGRQLLIPLWLNDECVPADDEPDVSCPDQTCAAGLCVNPRIKPELLPDHRSDWHAEPQRCGPSAPAVELGASGSPFEALTSDDVLVAEPGSQGLAHVHLSVRMRGLSPESMTVLTGLVPDTGQQLVPTWFDRPFEQDDDGCEVHELRAVLPLTWNTILQLGATVIEPTGNAEHSHVRIYVAGPEL